MSPLREPHRRLRVVHLLGELRRSGAEVMLRQSAPLWREVGVDVEVVATGQQRGVYADALERTGLRVHHLPFEARPSYFRSLRRLLREGAYDVVHVHPERAAFWHGCVARTVRGTGIVRTVHSVFVFDGALRLERTVQRGALRALGGRTVSVGAGVQLNERTRFHNPTVHIANWIDTEQFRPPTDRERLAARAAHHVPSSDHFVVISLGNCAEVKNHTAILHALTELPTNLSWWYLHAGEEGDHDERMLARGLGIGDRCRFLGPVEDVTTLLHAADVHVMPSLREGAGLAALEALAAGVPSVLGDSPGLRDLRTAVQYGVRWVAPTSSSVADGLRELWTRGGAASWSEPERMHRQVAQRFGVRRGVEAYLEVYRLAARPGRNRR